MNNVYDVTRAFEEKVAHYTGAPYCVAIDNESNALFLALMYKGVQGKEIIIPNRTYMSVPCEIIHAGGKVVFSHVNGNTITGAYILGGTNVWDSALRFTAGMYIPGSYMCCSFTGPYKHLKLGKGGCILTDNEDAYKWFKIARFSGREECSYHDQKEFGLGWNFYMLPEIATKGLRDMQQFYNLDGTKKYMPDIELPYPDLSKHPIYTQKHGISR
jgi:dTDP-4-amino-4,6-dideoxygalactose transaminase